MSELDDIEFEYRMSDTDQLMWTIEKDPLLRSTITAVMFLDRVPDREMLTERIERSTRVVPRLRQRVRSNPLSVAPPRWEIDPNFDLNYHLQWARAVGDGKPRDVMDMAEPIAMGGFDRARPLWRFLAVDGLESGGSAIIMKLHHAITDGVGGVKLMMEMLDAEREPATPRFMPAAPTARVWGQVERFFDAAVHDAKRNVGRARGAVGLGVGSMLRTLTDPVGEAHKAADTVASATRLLAPQSEPLSPIMTDRSLSQHFETLTVNLVEAKAAAKVAGGKLNDAFMAGVAGGIDRYHRRHGVEIPEIRISMPINTRVETTGDRAGNHFAPARFSLPVDIVDPVKRMARVNELVAAARDEPALALTDAVAGVLNRLPTTVTTTNLWLDAQGHRRCDVQRSRDPIRCLLLRGQSGVVLPLWSNGRSCSERHAAELWRRATHRHQHRSRRSSGPRSSNRVHDRSL